MQEFDEKELSKLTHLCHVACTEEEKKVGILETFGKRSLQFFPGIAKGSAYGAGKYSYENCKGVEAARISSSHGDCPIYFNGGCLFDLSNPSPNIQILGHYLDLENAPPAVVEINCGKGKALLSGVHIEYLHRLLNPEDAHLKSLIPIFEETDTLRRAIFRSYLDKLDVPLKN